MSAMEGRNRGGLLLRRRQLLRGFGVTAAGAAAAGIIGCGGDEGAPTAPPGGTATATAGTAAPSPSPTEAKPVRGGVYRLAYPGDPTNLDPYAGTSYTTTQICAWVYSRLGRWMAGPGIDAAAYLIEPDLAESIEADADGLRYVVKLRANAKWHPPISRPVDAEDVVFSWKRYTGQIPGTPANAAAPLLNQYLREVVAVDQRTVEFRLSKPRGEFLSSENKFLFIMPKETGQAFDPAKTMVGTGPWIFDSYRPGVGISFVRNPDWHLGPELPYFDRIEISFIPEYATRLTQFLAGNLDEVDVVGQDLGRVLNERRGSQIYVGESILPGSYISFQGGPEAANAPWRDVRVRRAISMALDRDAMLEAAYNLKQAEQLGLRVFRRWNNDVPSLEASHWLDPKGEFQYKAGDPVMTAENQRWFRYDPAAAKKLLEEAGYANGFRAKLHYTSARYGQAYNLLTELIQQYCAAIGIQLELVDDDYSAVFVTKTARGEFDGLAHIPRGAGARFQFEAYYKPGGTRNNAKVDDPALVAQIDKMLEERDSEKARKMILDLQNVTVEKMYYVQMQLGASGVYTAYGPDVRNALDYQVVGFDQGYETIPYYWKARA